MFLTILFACAPELEGDDQVYDANYSLKAAQDQALAAVPYPAADAIVDDLLDEGATGCGYALVSGGEVFYVQGIGTAAPGVPWSVETVAPLGSVAKTFTALGLLRLMEVLPGMSVDDSVQEYLPEAPWDVTLEELLTHQTGLGDWADFGDGPDLDAYPGEHPMASPRYAFDAFAPYEGTNPPTGIDPGTGLPNGDYSNVGYAVLAAVIDEVVSNEAFIADGYEQWVWYEVLRGSHSPDGSPTGAIYHSWRDNDIPNLAQGYIDGAPAAAWDVTGDSEGWEGPVGGWSMTAGDLGRFVAALQRGDIEVDPSWTDPVSAINVFSGASADLYGYGVVREPYPGGVTKITHPGDNDAFGAQWASFEDPDAEDFGVGIVCNAQVGKPNTDSVITRLRVAYANGELVPQYGVVSTTPVPSTALQGALYTLDLSESYTDLPGLGAPASELAGDLTLSARSYSRGLDLTLGGTDPRMLPVTFRGVDFARNPTFSSGTATVRLPLDAGGTLVLEQAQIKGTFSSTGGTVDGMTLSGRLDARSLPSLWISPSAACEEARLLGRPCAPCADKQPYCVTIAVQGISGRR